MQAASDPKWELLRIRGIGWGVTVERRSGWPRMTGHA